MAYATSIMLNGLNLSVESANFVKIQSMKNQIVGLDLRRKPTPDKQLQDWRGTINGTFFSSTRSNDRDTLQGFRDRMEKVTLTDGLHNGDYYVTNLRWLDDANQISTQERFQLTIIQDQ